MKFIPVVLLAAGLAAVVLPCPASADDTPIYRVEIIVLTHAGGRSDQRRVASIDDYSSLVDPLARAREAAETAFREAENAALSAETEDDARRVMDALDALEREPEIEEEEPFAVQFPDPYLNLDELSSTMRNAWQRLDNSGEFVPRAWRAWYQPLVRGRVSPRVRIHDERPVRLDWLGITPLGQLEPPTDSPRVSQVDHLMPRADFRLDGSLRLRQRQFMHVELDLVWREPAEWVPSYGPLVIEQIPEPGYIQHRLDQSRTIRPGRLEYFDSDWLGVLVWVERWEPPADPSVETPARIR